MEIVGSPKAPLVTTVAHRGSRSDEELVGSFWSEIGYPTTTSRVWENSSTPRNVGTCLSGSVCRVGGAALESASASDVVAGPSAARSSVVPRGIDVRSLSRVLLSNAHLEGLRVDGILEGNTRHRIPNKRGREIYPDSGPSMR
jgi:hypothetical protein